MVKKLKNVLQNQESFEAVSWYLASLTQGLPFFFQMMILGWLLTFSNLHSQTFVWGKCCPCPWAVCRYKFLKFLNAFYSETTTSFQQIADETFCRRVISTICSNYLQEITRNVANVFTFYASVFNTSLGTWRMLMHEKPCLIPIL